VGPLRIGDASGSRMTRFPSNGYEAGDMDDVSWQSGDNKTAGSLA